MTFKVIVTGAFGNVGQWVVTELVKLGHQVVAFDIKNERTEKKQSKLAQTLQFDTVWGDLTDENGVKRLIKQQKPDGIAHVAAVIAPTAYVVPEIAYKVNVLGSKYLIEAAENLGSLKRFVFISSYSVHGPRNPYKKLPPLTGDSPTNAGDNYGKHKVAIEKVLEEGKLDWTIIRLPAVLSVDSDFGTAPEFLRFGFMLDPDRNESGVDARDAGLAIANAVTTEEASRRKFNICGDPAQGWTGTAKELTGIIYKARGLPPFSDDTFRRADPEVDESWYYEDIVDPTESQKVLQYQRYSLDDYFQHIRKQAGFSRYLLRVIGPLVRGSLQKNSPYHGIDAGLQSGTVWDDVKRVFEIDESKLKIFDE